MPSRISGACNGCRTKKQKCSGDRSGCTQCLAAGIQCTWPEQRKRGPAKGYIEGLEHRLHEAESLLLSLLPLVTAEQLNCATDSLNATSSATHVPSMQTRDSQSPGPRTVRSSPPVLNKKTGIDYWDSFPLDTVDNIRKWQDDCATHSTGQNQSSFRNSSSGDDSLSREMMHNAFHSAHNSRPNSVDLSVPPPLSHARAQSGALRSMSTDSYRSGASTPVHVPTRHAQSQSTLPTSNHTRQQQQHQPPPPAHRQQQNWTSMSLFSSLSSPSGTATATATTNNTPNPNVNNVDMSNEALLLQSFADSTWAQSQSLNNNGMGNMSAGLGATNNNMTVESGPMEVDTGFFANDVQRSLFW